MEIAIIKPFCILLLVVVMMVSSKPANFGDGVSDGQSNVMVSSRNYGGNTFTSGFAAATGADGKMYYVKDVNGKVEQGVVEGYMPELDLSGIFNNVRLPSSSYYNNHNYYGSGSYYSGNRLNEDIRHSIRRRVAGTPKNFF